MVESITVPAVVEKCLVLVIAVLAAVAASVGVAANIVGDFSAGTQAVLNVVAVAFGTASVLIGAVWAEGINVLQSKLGEPTRADVEADLAELKIKSASQEAIIVDCYKDIRKYLAEIDVLNAKIAELEEEYEKRFDVIADALEEHEKDIEELEKEENKA